MRSCFACKFITGNSVGGNHQPPKSLTPPTSGITRSFLRLPHNSPCYCFFLSHFLQNTQYFYYPFLIRLISDYPRPILISGLSRLGVRGSPFLIQVNPGLVLKSKYVVFLLSALIRLICVYPRSVLISGLFPFRGQGQSILNAGLSGFGVKIKIRSIFLIRF